MYFGYSGNPGPSCMHHVFCFELRGQGENPWGEGHRVASVTPADTAEYPAKLAPRWTGPCVVLKRSAIRPTTSKMLTKEEQQTTRGQLKLLDLPDQPGTVPGPEEGNAPSPVGTPLGESRGKAEQTHRMSQVKDRLAGAPPRRISTDSQSQVWSGGGGSG